MIFQVNPPIFRISRCFLSSPKGVKGFWKVSRWVFASLSVVKRDIVMFESIGGLQLDVFGAPQAGICANEVQMEVSM